MVTPKGTQAAEATPQGTSTPQGTPAEMAFAHYQQQMAAMLAGQTQRTQELETRLAALQAAISGQVAATPAASASAPAVWGVQLWMFKKVGEGRALLDMTNVALGDLRAVLDTAWNIIAGLDPQAGQSCTLVVWTPPLVAGQQKEAGK